MWERLTDGAYEEAISARYAFSFAMSGSVFGNVACALAKWEKVAGPADPISFLEREVVDCFLVADLETLDINELKEEPIGVSSKVLKRYVG